MVRESDRLLTLQMQFRDDVSFKEAQLSQLIDKKQAELDHYEQCLRREAHVLAERED